MLREAAPDGSDPESRYVLRSTTTSDLRGFLGGAETLETAWLSPPRQFEEAWFLGLRLNRGVEVAAMEREFGREAVARAMAVVGRLVDDGLLELDGESVRLTTRGRMLSNDVFQEFLGLNAGEPQVTPPRNCQSLLSR